MFLNFSNHPSQKWSKAQEDAAKALTTDNEILDIEFPNVIPTLTTQEVFEIAERVVKDIITYNPEIVMCQGEFTLSYKVIEMLKEKGIKVVAACAERRVTEQNGRKVIEFQFEQFRDY